MHRGWFVLLAGTFGLGVATTTVGDGPAGEIGANITLIKHALERYAAAQDLGDRAARLAAFKQSAQLFTAVSERGVRSADLYANLGTAALQAEQVGRAIVAFRRALELAPGHPRATKNLLLARTLLPAWVPVPERANALDSFFFWHHELSTEHRVVAAAIFFLLSAAALGLGIRLRSRLARNLGFFALALWLIFGSSALVSHLEHATPSGVIMAHETQAYASDSPNAPTRFPKPLPAGTEVTLLEERNQWARVALADGQDGWLKRSAVQSIQAQRINRVGS